MASRLSFPLLGPRMLAIGSEVRDQGRRETGSESGFGARDATIGGS